LSLRPRHGYAVDIHHDLPASASIPAQKLFPPGQMSTRQVAHRSRLISARLKPVDICGGELAARPARAPSTPARVGRHPGHLEPGRGQPHPLAPGARLGVQPATIGVSHASGIAHAAPTVSGARNLRRK